MTVFIKAFVPPEECIDVAHCPRAIQGEEEALTKGYHLDIDHIVGGGGRGKCNE